MARTTMGGIEIDGGVTGRGPAVLLTHGSASRRAGHAVNLDRPEAFDRAARPFLDELG
jgi:hypothetical protein